MKLGDWISLVCLIAAGYILWTIRPLIMLSFTAVVIAIALDSITKRIEAFKVPRRFAIPIALFLSVLVAALFILGIVPPFIEQFTSLVERIVLFSQKIPGYVIELQTRLPERIRLPNLGEFAAWLTSPDSAILDVFGNFFSFFNSSLRVLVQTLFVTVLAIMMLANPEAYLNGIILLFPSFYRQRAREIFAECDRSLGNWLGGIVISSFFIFVLSFISLIILGVDLAFAHALLAGVLNFIPNLGPIISMVFPIIVTVLSEDPWKAIAVIVIYIIIQQIEAYWLTPTIMARQVSLLPAFTLIAQIFFAGVFGFLGLLLALPLTVVTKTWIQELLIKDLLDRWNSPKDRKLRKAIATNPVSHSGVPIPPAETPELPPAEA